MGARLSLASPFISGLEKNARGVKGDIVEQLMELRFNETVAVDGDRLVELCVRMGEAKAEEMIAVSIEELWNGLEQLRAHYSAGYMDELALLARVMSKNAGNLGLQQFARVARDVEGAARRLDGPALGACLCRLHRIADSSIDSVWDLCDITG